MVGKKAVDILAIVAVIAPSPSPSSSTRNLSIWEARQSCRQPSFTLNAGVASRGSCKSTQELVSRCTPSVVRRAAIDRESDDGKVQSVVGDGLVGCIRRWGVMEAGVLDEWIESRRRVGDEATSNAIERCLRLAKLADDDGKVEVGAFARVKSRVSKNCHESSRAPRDRLTITR